MSYNTIQEYAWDDTSDSTAKVYLTKGLDGIKQLDPANIQCDFEAQFVDLKIRDFKGRNLRFKIDPLFDQLKVEACAVNVKSNSITLVLKKLNQRKWTSLKWVKPIQSSEPEPGNGQRNT